VPRARLAAILLAAAALYTFQLHVPEFWGRHWESRRALVARAMVEEGHWWVPHQNGAITLNKPPLYYWLVAGTMGLVGNHDELGARLPSAAAAVVGLALVWRWGRLAGGAAGGFAVLFLLGNVLYFGHARTAEMDMVLLAVETGAALAFLEARARPRAPAWSWLGWSLAAAGFLIKGPVGVVVPLAVVLVYRIGDALDRDGPRGWVRAGRGLPLFALLALPWYVAMLAEFPWAGDAFFRQTATRVRGNLDHVEPFWFYLPVLLGGLLPATLFVPAWIRGARRRSPEGSHLRRLAWVLAVLFVVFSASGSKRVYYVLPLWAPAAAGFGIAAAARRRENPGARDLLVPAGALGALLAVAAVAVPLVPAWGGPPFFRSGLAATLVLAIVAGSGALGVLAARRGRFERSLGWATAALAGACVFNVLAVAPVSNAYRSRADFARAVAAAVPPGAPIVAAGLDNFALPFYAGRDIPEAGPLCERFCREPRPRVLHVVLDPAGAERLAADGFTMERVLEGSWAPPGRPHRVQTLILARVRGPSCACS
jgi:4-amino-4-deoxy-L-arabinose transferase-like glycosyltransferase